MASKANAVSQKHKEVSREMWSKYDNLPKIEGITNAQNAKYWTDPELKKAFEKSNRKAFSKRKHELKVRLFEEVADQTGKLFDPNVFTMVWARRFAGYKRADLIARDFERFQALLSSSKYPVQIIWAGKPYPFDHGAVNMFNNLVRMTFPMKNAATLTGYELRLSHLLKKGCDVWLNNPRIPLEASGTSGMTAAMNGAVNFSTYDGWIIEFASNGKNSFVIPPVDQSLPEAEQDRYDIDKMYSILEHEILPIYYDNHDKWHDIVWQGYEDVIEYFGSERMADEYYTKMYK